MTTTVLELNVSGIICRACEDAIADALLHTRGMADVIAADLSRMAPLHQLMRQIMSYETGLNSISCHRKPENARFVTMTPYDWDGHLEYMKGGQLMIEEQFAQDAIVQVNTVVKNNEVVYDASV